MLVTSSLVETPQRFKEEATKQLPSQRMTRDSDARHFWGPFGLMHTRYTAPAKFHGDRKKGSGLVRKGTRPGQDFFQLRKYRRTFPVRDMPDFPGLMLAGVRNFVSSTTRSLAHKVISHGTGNYRGS